jgi:hypothetical protein
MIVEPDGLGKGIGVIKWLLKRIIGIFEWRLSFGVE